MSPQIADTVRRIGRADAAGLYRMAAFLATLEPELEPRLERPGGGWLVALGPGHLVNKVCGLGLNGPVDDAALDAVERTLREAGVDPRIEHWPGADPGLQVMLEVRGYRIELENDVLVADPAAAPAHSEAGVGIERVTRGLADLYERTVACGFTEMDAGEPGFAERVFARGAAHSTEASAWLARIGGEPAGGGALGVTGGVAALFGASTLPRMRRRGVQRALLERRLREAHAAGAGVAFMKTAPGSGSARNALRAGFQVAGRSVTWVLERERSER